MQKKHRNFGPMSTSGLSEEVRKAVNAAFDAMSTWRTETAENSEKNSAQVIEKMAEAGRVLGWPQEKALQRRQVGDRKANTREPP